MIIIEFESNNYIRRFIVNADTNKLKFLNFKVKNVIILTIDTLDGKYYPCHLGHLSPPWFCAGGRFLLDTI